MPQMIASELILYIFWWPFT